MTSGAKNMTAYLDIFKTKSKFEVKFVYIFFLRGIMKGTFFDVLKKDSKFKPFVIEARRNLKKQT